MYDYMVKCYENAYQPKNLSFFAFNVEGYWGQIKKKLKETKSQMFLSISLHLWKYFAFLQGVHKIVEKLFSFFSLNKSWLSFLDLVSLNIEKKRKKLFDTFFGRPVEEQIIFRGAKT